MSKVYAMSEVSPCASCHLPMIISDAGIIPDFLNPSGKNNTPVPRKHLEEPTSVQCKMKRAERHAD